MRPRACSGVPKGLQPYARGKKTRAPASVFATPGTKNPKTSSAEQQALSAEGT